MPSWNAGATTSPRTGAGPHDAPSAEGSTAGYSRMSGSSAPDAEGGRHVAMQDP